MAEAKETFVRCVQFLEFLKALPWCKQGENVLVAVHKGTPEVVEVMGDHELKVFPGGMTVKMNKSTINNFIEKFNDGQPLPVVLVWKPEGVEIWYRKYKSADFPYDTWSDPVAAGYERERVFVPKEHLGTNFASYHSDIISRAKECPSIIQSL
jgi:hypothetical protein